MFLERRPKDSARLSLWEAIRIEAFSRCARNQGGNNTEEYVDFALPGGRKIARREISPLTTRVNFLIKRRWCAAGSKPQRRDHSTILLRVFRRSSRRRAASVIVL